MRPGTEDLLSVRDGGPVDAGTRAAVEADPALRAEVARLRVARERLRELPELKPPPGVLAKIFAEIETRPEARRVTQPEPQERLGPGLVRPVAAEAGAVDTAGHGPRFRLWRYAQWSAGSAIAAAVAVVAVLGVRFLDEPGQGAPGTILAENLVPRVGSSAPGGTAATYASLTSESARLERLLNAIPHRPRLVNAATVTTISGLEDRIGQVDEVLMYAGLDGLRSEQAVALWQERVDLMNALLEVRYAQARRFGF